MRIRELFEAPIDDLTRIGDWSKNSSFGKTDRAILNSPKGVQKIVTKWARCPFHFNVVLVNKKQYADQFAEQGEVDMAWLQQKMPDVASDPNFKISPDAINIIYVSNRGDERVQISAWILAHRLGHALSRFDKVREFTEAKDWMHRMLAPVLDCYGVEAPETDRELTKMRMGSYDRYRVLEKELVAFYEAIGTMKSARESQVRNEFEFILELLAQYIVTGRIKFNPLPKHYKVGRYYRSFQGSDMDYRYYNDGMEDVADTVTQAFETMLDQCVGRTFIC